MTLRRALFRDRSLWFKLSLLAVTPTVVVMLVIVLRLVTTVQNAIIEGTMARNENLTRLAALSLSNAHAVYHKALLDNLVDGLARQDDIRFAAVVDAGDRRILAHSDHAKDGGRFDAASPGPPEGRPGSEQLLRAPVVIEDKRFAEVIVAFSLHAVNDRAALARVQIFSVAALVALAGVGLAVLLAGRISRPVLALAAKAQALGQGRFEAGLVYDSKDAIGQLASAFNAMVEAIGQRQEELENEILVRRRAEEFWRRYEFIVNASRDWNTLINRDYVYEAANNAYCQCMNLSRDRIIGRSVARIWGEAAFAHDIRPRLDRCLAGDEVNYQVWLDIVAPAANCYDVTLYPYRDGSGRVTHAVVVSHDITAQKHAEQAIEKRAQQMTVLNTIGRRVNASLDPQAVVQALMDSLSQSMDAGLVALFLVEQDELVFKARYSGSDRQPPDVPQMDAARALSLEARRKGRTVFGRHRPPEGPEQPFGPAAALVLAAIPLTKAGRVFGVLCLGHEGQRDWEAQAGFLETLAGEVAIGLDNALLHAQIQAHAAELEMRVAERTARLAAAMEKAKESDRLKSAFLAAMSHELRTPLNSIIGFTGILLQGLVGDLNPEQTKQLGMVNHSAQHLLSLINDVLDISKIEAGQLQLVNAPFDMGQVIDKMIQTARPLADKKAIGLQFKAAPEVGRVLGDRRRVEQILLNLLSNAIKFTDAGHVTVDCRMADGGLETAVSDTGIGIREEDFGKLFNAFQQLETGLTRRFEGTGLGLSICKKLVELMGGAIRVHSRPGQGSTFTFTLPPAARATR